MDWRECIEKEIVKEASTNTHKIRSLKEIASLKRKSANTLPKEHHISIITLLYDSLRETLEATALGKGYKIYNHECYKAFLQEILNEEYSAQQFDMIRKVRNGINYYGRKVQPEEAQEIITTIQQLIQKFT